MWPFSIVMLLGATCAAADQEWNAVDIPAGRYTETHRLPLDPNSGVECRFRYTKARFSDAWHPSISIIFAEKGDFREDTEDKHFFVKMGLRKDHSRVYSVVIYGFKELYDSAFLGLSGDVDEHILRLEWRDDGVFTYHGSEGSNGFGEGYILDRRISPRFAIVTASGFKGEFSCRSYAT